VSIKPSFVNVLVQSVERDSILCNAVWSARQMMQDETIRRVRVSTIVDCRSRYERRGQHRVQLSFLSRMITCDVVYQYFAATKRFVRSRGQTV
jgi:hypothetical protein